MQGAGRLKTNDKALKLFSNLLCAFLELGGVERVLGKLLCNCMQTDSGSELQTSLTTPTLHQEVVSRQVFLKPCVLCECEWQR